MDVGRSHHGISQEKREGKVFFHLHHQGRRDGGKEPLDFSIIEGRKEEA